MKKIFLYFLIASLSIVEGWSQNASNAVRVNLNITGPYSTNIMDYAPSENNRMAKMIVTVQNLTRVEQKIYLRGDIRGVNNDVRIFTDTDYVPSTAITLRALETRQLFSHEIMDLYDPNHLTYIGTNQAEIQRSRHVPEGEYSICVRAFDHNPGRTNIPLSPEQPNGCFSVFMRNIEPPILIQPQAEAEVKALSIQNVIFSWTVPAGAPAGTTYRLKIVEMFDSKRNPNDAFLSATTPAIFERDLVSPVYVYGPADVPLVPGRKYAWAVSVVDSRGNTSFQNQGRSEVRAFTYGNVDAVQVVESVTQKKAISDKLTNIKFTADLTIRPLHLNRFKGKLVWAFRKTENTDIKEPATKFSKDSFRPDALPGNMGGKEFYIPNLEVASAQLYKNATGSSTTNAPTDGGILIPATNNFFSLGTSATMVTSAVAPKVEASILMSKGAQHQMRIKDLAGDTRYPLVGTKVSLYLQEKLDKPRELAPKTILIGSTTTNADGEFDLNYHDEIPPKYDAFLKIENSHFEFASYDIRIVKGQNGTYDFGELLGLAKTYRVKMRIVNEQDMELDSTSFKIVRKGNYYHKSATSQNLKHEGMREILKGSESNKTIIDDKNVGKIIEDVVAEGKTGAYMSRFFFSNGMADSYYVVVEGEGVIKTTKILNLSKRFTPDIKYSDENEVPVLEFKVLANIPLPTVRGRIVISDQNVPVKGASVIVRKEGSKSGTSVTTRSGMIMTYIDINARSGISDSLGYFKIENIPVDSIPYQLYVKYKGKETILDKRLFLSVRGTNEDLGDVRINAELITVIGKVIDTQGEPLPNATLTWKTGGNAFYTDDDGNFTGVQTEGTHTLIARKPGFKDTDYKIELKVEKKPTPPATQGSSGKSEVSNVQVSNWSSNILNLQNNFKAVGYYNGKTVVPKTSAKVVTSNLTADKKKEDYYAVHGDGVASETISSGHVIVLGNFYVKAIVKDQTTGQPIADASVTAENDTEITKTNTEGVAIVGNVPGGNAAIVVNGPVDSFYAGVKAEIVIDPSKDTVTVEVNLKTGSRAQGKVMLKGAAVAGAEVVIEGLEHIKTETDSDGNYTLVGVPVGEYTLMASKEGLLANKQTGDFVANEVKKLDFSLTDPGFNASRLLGFKLILHKSDPGTRANEFVISGELVELPDNPIFKIAENKNFRIKFTNKTIVKEGNLIYPKDNEMVTDVSQIKLKVFDYLAITLKNQGGLKIRPVSGNKSEGEIIGTADIDIAGTFSVLSGIKLPNTPLSLKSGTNTVIAPIRSSGGAGVTSFGINGSTDGWSLYGIKVIPDLAGSGIDNNGINLKGKVKIEGVPVLSNQELQLQKLTISKRGEITAAEINLNPAPTLSIATWKLKLTGVKINQYGLKLSGDLDVQIPSSPNAKIVVRELGVNGSNLTGGTFLLPQAGIDIFGLVKFKTNPGKDFTFQKLAGANHYRFIGAGTIKLPEWLKQDVELDNFSIATNGHFSVIAKLDVEVNFADMAKLGITKFGFASNTKTITVGGKFRLNIPMFGVGADGTLHYQFGRAPVMDELGINFNLGSAIALEAAVKFNKDNFRGKGGLKLAGISGIGLEFWYEQKKTGPRVGAQFMANMVIPIGVVKLDRLSGGFDFDFDQNIYSIKVGGRITVAPDPAGLVALDPLRLTITSTPQGPIFEGNAGVKVMDAWSVASATMKLDFAKKHFFIDGKFGVGFSMMKGLSVENESGVRLELFTGGDNYWLVAGYSKTKIFEIFDTGVTIAAGWNVPRNTHESLRNIPNYALHNGRLYGGYFGTYSKIDIGSPSISLLKIVTLTAWYKNTAEMEVFANFKSESFGFKLNSSWRAGADVSVWGIGSIASADIRFGGGLEAYYNRSNWGMNGRLNGSARGHIGCGDKNDCGVHWKLIVPCGVTLCASGHARIGYDSNSGFDVSLHLGQ